MSAKTPPVTQSIDRRSYDVTKDLRANSGTLADILGAVPSISVDAKGGVSIRGDSNVVIMIDGKPTTQFQGAGGAQALQSLPADQYARVEVITNPPASMAPDGTAGIINLVTKQVTTEGLNGVVRVNADPTGRWNTQASASGKTGKLSLSLSGGLRHDLIADDISQADSAVAQPGIPAFRTYQTTHGAGAENSGNVRAALTYAPDAATSLSLEGHYNGFDDPYSQASQTRGAGATGGLEEVLNRDGQEEFHSGDGGAQAGLKRTFGARDGDLSASVLVDRTATSFSLPFTDISELPVAPEAFDNVLTASTLTLTDVQAAYERPVASKGKFSVGYEFKLEAFDQTNIGFTNAPTPSGPFDASQADTYRFDRQTNAVFATYEQEIARLSLQLGLRYEQSNVSLNDQAANIAANNGDSHAFPTAHLAYALAQDQQITASYGERIQRPLPNQYDPYRDIISPFYVGTGTPTLQPQYTKTFEVGWDEKAGSTYFRVGGYYKINSGIVNQAVTDLGNDTFLYTWENLLNGHDAGGEVEASGALTHSWSYSLSGTLIWSHIDASPLAQVVGRSLVTEDGHATLTWQPGPKDSVQLLLRGSGRKLTAQGYRTPWGKASLSYRHKFSDRLSAFVSAEDVFDADRYGHVVITPLLTESDNDDPRDRVVYVGIAWSFGAGTKSSIPLVNPDEGSTGH